MEARLLGDEAAMEKPLRHGSVTDALAFNYLGRVVGGIPEGGFFVHIRPQ